MVEVACGSGETCVVHCVCMCVRVCARHSCVQASLNRLKTAFRPLRSCRLCIFCGFPGRHRVRVGSSPLLPCSISLGFPLTVFQTTKGPCLLAACALSREAWEPLCGPSLHQGLRPEVREAGKEEKWEIQPVLITDGSYVL